MALRKTEQQWLVILEKFTQSNKSARQWCQEEGVSYQSLLKWKKKSVRSAFVELKDEEPFELILGSVKVTFREIQDLRNLALRLNHLC